MSDFAQQIMLTGRVVDASSGDPIPFVNVAIADIYKGTSTNINGEFLLKLDSLPVKLIISHISYEKLVKLIEDTAQINIALNPGKLILKELFIQDDRKGKYAYNLLTRAYDMAVRHSRNWKYGLAFYRQISQNADDYSELYEIFYDTRYSSQGIEDWAIQEGRYAMKTETPSDNFVFNKNFTLLTRLATMFQPETDTYIMPVNSMASAYFDAKVKELRNVEGRKIAVVDFKPLKQLKQPAMEGEIMIDIDTYEILKLHGVIRSDKLNIVALTNSEGYWKNYVLGIDIAYKPMDDDLYLDYISVNQTFDYYLNNQFDHKVSTNSYLTYYEYYHPEKFKRLGGRLIRYSKSDREILDKVGYNKRFWNENPVVKRTPIEEQVISSFESVRAFGSIYLNDRNQIQLEKDDLENDPFVQEIAIKLKGTKLASLGEKVYLHLDKPFYANGETIWFNAFIVNAASHIPINISGVLYVDLISPEGNIIRHKRLKIEDAYADGEFEIPEDLTTGRYRLRAYTNWMKNYDAEYFFDKPLNIYNSKQVLEQNYYPAIENKDFNVTFFPEGGNLVYDIPSQVAFKAVDDQGESIEIQGKIVDESGNQVAEFETRHDGMGSFFIIPQTGKKLTAEINALDTTKEFELPHPLSQGLEMAVNNLKDKDIQILIKTSPSYYNSRFYLIGQTRGIIYHRQEGNFARGSAVLNIPKSKLPDGIFQITLFDSNHLPVCERLVFINNGEKVFSKINDDKQIIRARDPVTLTMEFKDQFGRALKQTRFSVAVTDAGHLLKNQEDENIMTNLLLTSDLKGTIRNPGYYFINDDRETKIALDLVMLTHGWRRFSWEKILSDTTYVIRYSHESAINLQGMVYRLNRDEPVTNAFLDFISVDNDFRGYWFTTIDNRGQFEMKGLEIPDTLKVIAKSLDDKGKPVDVDLSIQYPRPYPCEQLAYQQYPAMVNDDIIHYLNQDSERKLIDKSYNFSDRIVLKEVVIKDQKYRNPLYGTPDAVIKNDESMNSFTDIFQMMQGRVSGLFITGFGLDAKISIRGISSFSSDNTPLFVVDGIPIVSFSRNISSQSDTTGTGTSDVDLNSINSILMTINPRDVDRIEVLKNPGSTGAFGVRGGNGVILIYTKKGVDTEIESKSKGFNEFRLPGFSIVKKFYLPDYSRKTEENIKPDRRTTVYWNPDVTTNNLGEATINFYNSDVAGILQVEIEGVSNYGDPVHVLQLIGANMIK